MSKILSIAAIAFSAIVSGTLAAGPAAAGGAVVRSEPGKVEAANIAEVTATVAAIDKGTRLVTLKGPEGRTVNVVAGEEVKNLDQINVGDTVVLQYLEALTLELKKGPGIRQRTEREAITRAQPGEKPAGAIGRQVTIVADVVDVSPEKNLITLKGPDGNIVDLRVQNPDHFKVVKKGDQVEAVYTEAVALSVEPAAKPAAKKQ